MHLHNSLAVLTTFTNETYRNIKLNACNVSSSVENGKCKSHKFDSSELCTYLFPLFPIGIRTVNSNTGIHWHLHFFHLKLNLAKCFHNFQVWHFTKRNSDKNEEIWDSTVNLWWICLGRLRSVWMFYSVLVAQKSVLQGTVKAIKLCFCTFTETVLLNRLVLLPTYCKNLICSTKMCLLLFE